MHLAAYFDFTGEENALYQELNVDGTRRLLRALRHMKVDQIVYSGTMLVYEAGAPGRRIDENAPLNPKWVYPRSKAAAEKVLRDGHNGTPLVLLQLAGLYDDVKLGPTLAHQVARIYERKLESHFYSGSQNAAQSMVHAEDMAKAFRAAVDRRQHLKEEVTILIGEPDPPSYAELQDEIGELLFGEAWSTQSVPASVAAAGAWIEEATAKVAGQKKPFLRPYMMGMASDNYSLDIGRARRLLDWRPGA